MTRGIGLIIAFALAAAMAQALVKAPASVPSRPLPAATADGIHKIQHVVIIMQENRSFDSYFGTFPGADGIPMKDGVPSACVPDPDNRTCVRPFYDVLDRDRGGPHNGPAAITDVDGGRM